MTNQDNDYYALSFFPSAYHHTSVFLFCIFFLAPILIISPLNPPSTGLASLHSSFPRHSPLLCIILPSALLTFHLLSIT
jgi:hypothetical protein